MFSNDMIPCKQTSTDYFSRRWQVKGALIPNARPSLFIGEQSIDKNKRADTDKPHDLRKYGDENGNKSAWGVAKGRQTDASRRYCQRAGGGFQRCQQGHWCLEKNGQDTFSQTLLLCSCIKEKSPGPQSGADRSKKAGTAPAFLQIRSGPWDFLQIMILLQEIAGPKKRDSLSRWNPTRRLSHEQANWIFSGVQSQSSQSCLKSVSIWKPLFNQRAVLKRFLHV